jgi:hypothetical protein
VIRQAGILIALPILIVGLVAVPLGLFLGSYQWQCSGIAIGLTVPAGVVTLLASTKMNKIPHYGRVIGLLVGTMVRLIVGFGGGSLVFFASGPMFQSDPVTFWLWLLGAYLTTLTIEMILLGS